MFAARQPSEPLLHTRRTRSVTGLRSTYHVTATVTLNLTLHHVLTGSEWNLFLRTHFRALHAAAMSAGTAFLGLLDGSELNSSCSS